MEKAINNRKTTKWHVRHWPGFHHLRSLIFTQQVKQERLLQSAKVPWECHVLGPWGIFGSSGFLNSCSKLMNLDQTHFSTSHRVNTCKNIPYGVRKQLQLSSLVISAFRMRGMVVSLMGEKKYGNSQSVLYEYFTRREGDGKMDLTRGYSCPPEILLVNAMWSCLAETVSRKY